MGVILYTKNSKLPRVNQCVRTGRQFVSVSKIDLLLAPYCLILRRGFGIEPLNVFARVRQNAVAFLKGKLTEGDTFSDHCYRGEF